MYLPFEQLPGHSRLWVYQADRVLTAAEQELISTSLQEFCSGWKAHGHPLHTSFRISHGHFIIIAADEQAAGATGCSIDSSVRHLKQLGAQLGIDLFNRGQVAFLRGDQVDLAPVSGLKAAFTAGTLTPETLIFNTLVSTISEFETGWIIPAGRSWLSRYMPSEKAV